MAYGIKYRSEFKDFYSNTVVVHILEDGYLGSLTNINPAGSTPLTLEWPSDRGEIFDPVRGGLATFRFYATSENQFSEFFEAGTKQYKLRIIIGGSGYWTGYIMLGDYYESLSGVPYEVELKANDLGYLKYDEWDVTSVGRDEIIDVLFTILDSLSFGFNIKERVNIYEDSINSTSSDSMLDQILIQENSLVSDAWEGIDLYTALGNILRSFNCFIMQEDEVWNICRVPDLRITHNYRLFTSGASSSSGSEDIVSDFSNYKQLNRSGVLLSTQNYKTLSLYKDTGLRDLVNNGLLINPDVGISDVQNYWTESGTLDFRYIRLSTFINTSDPNSMVYPNAIILNAGSSTRRYIDHDKNYNVFTGTKFYVHYKGFHDSSAADGTRIRISINVNDTGTVYYLNMTDGTWSTSSSNANITLAEETLAEGQFETDALPVDGILSIRLNESDATGAAATVRTYYYLSIRPSDVGAITNFNPQDFSEDINTNSLEKKDTITFKYGDPIDADGADILMSSLLVASSGAGTDQWNATSGSVTDELLELTRDCYQAQYQYISRRLQATLKKDGIKYLEAPKISNRVFCPSGLNYDVLNSEMYGEWIEIKYGLEANQVTDFTNGIPPGTTPYDTFSESANTATITKTQTSNDAYLTVEDISIVDGARYYLVADITVNSGTVPDFLFRTGYTAKTDLVSGLNYWEVISEDTIAANDMYFYNDALDVFDGEITFTVQEMYGL